MCTKAKIMVLCLSLSWVSLAFGQLGPRKTAEQFFTHKLEENRIPPEFYFDEPQKYGDIWIFESQNPDGFVLVKEDDQCTIVGYSVQNLFTLDHKIPEPARAFMESISAMPDPLPDPARLKTRYNPVGPMIRTTWSQEGYFNYYCPEDLSGPDERTYAGCAAVAMGQIIRYFGKYNDFLLIPEMDDETYGHLTATLGNFDWNRMENRPITIDTEVSKLLYGLGVLVGMDYGPSGSTTSNYMVYNGFKKLKYFDAIRMIRSSTTPEVWIRNFTENIAHFQPVYVSGSGHSFICDGIDADGLFHFNIGWYGYADGYYPLGQIIGLTPSEAIFNLKPYSNNLSPENLVMDTLNNQQILRWEKNHLSTIDPTLYRVYLNDSIVYESHDTSFNTNFFPPGNHELMVAALYPQGESPWIGPILLSVTGKSVHFTDIALSLAIQEELMRENVTPLYEDPTINQLLKISQLVIRQPVSNLAGMENCHNLQILTLIQDEPTQLDLGPVSLLKRLKWLELKNIQAINPGLLAQNDRLVHLELIKCPLSDPGFLTRFTQLITLSLTDIQIQDAQLFSPFINLRELTASGCNLSNAGFAQNLTNLRYLDLSRNQLPRFRLYAKLPFLNHLNISHNQINDLFFMEFVPGIQSLNLGYNQINRFITGLYFKNLEELDLSNNLIDSLSMQVPLPTLTRLSMENNRIRTVKYLTDYAPGLTTLNLSGNNIQEFWQGSMQKLAYLNMSGNRIDLINKLPANPLLKHIDLSFNLISDLYPVFDHTNSRGIKYLDLTGNPLSVESMRDFTPALSEEIDTLLMPEQPQILSPGNPFPIRNQSVTGTSTTLSWVSEGLAPGAHFEIVTGSSPDLLSAAGISTDPEFPLLLDPGQKVFWRVRTVLADTTFLSGLFNFNTYQPITLPYRETFETYTPFALFSESSSGWIRAISQSSAITDGWIDPYRRSEGKQSLKLTNASHLRLPLNHLFQSALYISMQVLIGDGCVASVQVNDINGSNLRLYFKSNKRCDVFLNNQLYTELTFRTGEWFSLQFNFYSNGNSIMLEVGSIDQFIDWTFTGKVVHVGEIEMVSSSGINWPRDGQPLFHVDDIQIKASGSVQAETIPLIPEFRIYPNPANEMVYLDLNEEIINPVILLYEFTGRVMPVTWVRESPGRWRCSTATLPDGIYLLSVRTLTNTQSARILIIR